MKADSIIWAAASAFLILRLAVERLIGRYPFVVAFLAGNVAISLVLGFAPALHPTGSIVLLGLQTVASLTTYSRTAICLVNFTRGSLIVGGTAMVVSIAIAGLLRLGGFTANEMALAIFIVSDWGILRPHGTVPEGRQVPAQPSVPVRWIHGLLLAPGIRKTHPAPIAIIVLWVFLLNKDGEAEAPLPADSDYDVMVAEMFADLIKKLFR